MENHVNDLFQIQESLMTNAESLSGISSYVSCIKIKGKPILPPLITEEKRRELNNYRKKAIEIECRLADGKQRSATFVKTHSISLSENSLIDVPPNKQSTPARPATLQLIPNITGKTFILSSSSDSKIVKNSLNQDKIKARKDINSNISSDSISSPKSTNKSKIKLFRSTLEQRIANEENTSARNRKNIYEQSPIVEENYPLISNDCNDSDDSKKDKKSWSPLKIDSINSLRIELSNKESQPDENLCISFDDLENSSGTLTASPNLMRQNSYTLLTPSPALLQYLETQKGGGTKRSQSGRKTWDLNKAKKNWNPTLSESNDNLNKSLDVDQTNDDTNQGKIMERENSSSLDGFSVFQSSNFRNSSPNEHRSLNSFTDDGSTSPSSYSFKINSPKFQKIKCKIKSRRIKTYKNVPSPKSTDKVPTFGSNSTQGRDTVFVPLHIKEELTDLSNLLMKMKLEHERQKMELENKQKSEMKELELLFKRRESELLGRVSQETNVCPRTIYSQFSEPCDGDTFHIQMLGDGRHNATVIEKSSLHRQASASSLTLEDCAKRPQSAKGYYTQVCLDNDSRRTRSMDFNQVRNQDTDYDVSFQDSLQSKVSELYVGNEDLIETDTISNFSSRSSTISSDTKLESMPLLDLKKFRSWEVSPEEFLKYNQAACVITAAARGFLTRRLLRTAHVQGLITTLRDAISCATQLHGASDLGESDVDLMKRLGRQIEAAWDAVYGVFFDTDIPTKMQLIASDRDRLRSISSKAQSTGPKKRISSATMKSLRRKSGSELMMSKSQTSNGSNKTKRIRSKMIASYPSPAVSYKLK